MRQIGKLDLNETLDRNQLIEMLNTKINTIDWNSAKADMRSFISDPQRIVHR